MAGDPAQLGLRVFRSRRTLGGRPVIDRRAHGQRMTPTRPNILIVMTDQERYPPPYETDAVAEFRRTQLPGRERIRARGVELHHHYVCSTACTPSRASLFTGQYPSLHGLTNTDGLAKTATDPGMNWLDPATVPTLGDWFRAAGYDTYYRGKWHISHADLIAPGTHDGLKTNDATGSMLPGAVDLYDRADRLDQYGFHGWIGREPHGADPSDTGVVRDPLFAVQMADLFGHVVNPQRARPWLAVASFVNPHDIAFAGPAWQLLGLPPPDDTVPDFPAAPSQGDSLDRRPRCQSRFRELWPKALLDVPNDTTYRRLYLWLHKLVDAAIDATLDALDRSGAADETIVVFTSDHGDLLGAHGGLQQKWFNAYDEAVHVPMVIAGPGIANAERVSIATSHVDLLPTLLGLVGADAEELADTVAQHHTEVQALPGRDLSPMLTGRADASELDAPIYFMTEDRITTGLRERGVVSREPYEGVSGNASIESVIAHEAGELWKLNHYYDVDPTSSPTDDEVVWELHNLTRDPEERDNVAHDGAAFDAMHALLEEARARNRLTPAHTN